MASLPEVRREPGLTVRQPADFDEWEAWLDSDDPNSWFEADPPVIEPRPDLGAHVDLAVGKFFRGKWRQRLSDAQGDCGYVARQMRKSGVPIELALVILLMPEQARSGLCPSSREFQHQPPQIRSLYPKPTLPSPTIGGDRRPHSLPRPSGSGKFADTALTPLLNKSA